MLFANILQILLHVSKKKKNKKRRRRHKRDGFADRDSAVHFISPLIPYVPRIKSLHLRWRSLARASFLWASLRIRVIYESGDVDPRGRTAQWRRRVATLSSRTKKRNGSWHETCTYFRLLSSEHTRGGETEGESGVGYRPEVRPGRQTERRPPSVSSGLRLIQNPDYLCVPQAVQAARCLTRRSGRRFALFFRGLSLHVWRSRERESERAFLCICVVYFLYISLCLRLFLSLPHRIGINVDVDKGISTACLLLAADCRLHASTWRRWRSPCLDEILVIWIVQERFENCPRRISIVTHEIRKLSHGRTLLIERTFNLISSRAIYIIQRLYSFIKKGIFALAF